MEECQATQSFGLVTYQMIMKWIYIYIRMVKTSLGSLMCVGLLQL
jgi:hypothetical protein